MLVLAAHNPLIPAGYDILWSAIAVVLFAVVVAAFVSVVRHQAGLTGIQVAIWMLLIVAVPVLGAVVWFVAGHPDRRRPPVAPAATR